MRPPWLSQPAAVYMAVLDSSHFRFIYSLSEAASAFFSELVTI